MIYFVLTGVIAAILRKKNPLTIITIDLKVPYLMIGCLVAQFILAWISLNYHNQYPLILNSTFLVMILCLFMNRHLPGVLFVFLGAFMNTLALLLHGGLMPVSENVIKMVDLKDSSFDTDSRHQLMEDTNFWWLGDWIPFFTPIGSNSVLSPGDLIVGIGLIVFIVRNSARRGPYSE